MGKKSRKKVTRQAANQTATDPTPTGPVRSPPQATGSTRPSASRASTSTTRTSRAGVTDPFQPTTQAELEAIKSPPVASSNELDPEKASEDATCWICLEGPSDGNEEALRRNCACRYVFSLFLLDPPISIGTPSHSTNSLNHYISL